MDNLPVGFTTVNTGKRKCRYCQYFELGYCNLFETMVNEDNLCALYMPIFDYKQKDGFNEPVLTIANNVV